MTAYAPLTAACSGLLETAQSYLDTRGDHGGCARELFVHVNTVRYRLRRIAAITNLDPTDAREGHTLRIALGLGWIQDGRPTRVDAASTAGLWETYNNH